MPDVPMDAYGPVVIGNGRSWRPGDEGFEEAQANAVPFPMRDTENLSDFKPLGFTWDGHMFLFGEGEVSIERFNEVMGGDIGGGWHLSFESGDDNENAANR